MTNISHLPFFIDIYDFNGFLNIKERFKFTLLKSFLIATLAFSYNFCDGIISLAL